MLGDDDRFGNRLFEVARDMGGIPAFAPKLRVSDTTYRKWVRMESEPTRSDLVNIANLGNVKLDWLINGSGPKRPGDPAGDDEQFNPQRLTELTRVVENETKSMKSDAAPAKILDVAVSIYSLIGPTRRVDIEAVRKLVKMIFKRGEQ
jgi:hypothetical protein